MSLFSDRKYCKAGKDEKDMILGYTAERGKNPTKIKKKKIQQQRERKKCMDDFKEKKNNRTTRFLCYCKQTTLKHSGLKSSCSATAHVIYPHSLHFHRDQTPFFPS